MENLLPSFLLKRENLAKALFERPTSLSEILPFEEFIEDYNVFLNKDGTLGAVFEIKSIEHEPLDADEIIRSVEAASTWFDVPENCVLQVIHEQSLISPKDKVWNEIKKAYPTPSRVSEKVLEDRITTYKNLYDSDSEIKPIRRKSFLTIKYFSDGKSRKTWSQLLKTDVGLLFNETKDFVRELKRFSQTLEQIKGNSRIALKQLEANELLASLRLFFNPKEAHKREFARFNKFRSLSDQIIYSPVELDYEGLTRDGLKTRSITLKAPPQFAVPGLMADLLKLNFPYRIGINFSIPQKTKVKRALSLKATFLENAPSAEGRRQEREIQNVEERLAHGDRCLHMTFSIVIDGKTDDELETKTRKVLSVIHNELETEAIVEKDIGTGICLNTLPLFYSPEADISSQRYIKILKSDALRFLPIFESFRGLENPQQIYLSRENNLVRFSLTENATSNHTVVLGDTGSGKSAFVLDCLQAAKRNYPDPLVFVVEKKASSKMLCKYEGGEVTVFEAKGDIPFTAFRGHFDDTKVNFLRLLILSAIKLTNPTFEPESEHTTIIEQALKKAYIQKTQDSTLRYEDGEFQQVESTSEALINMDDVVSAMGVLQSESEFEALGLKIEELVHKLRPFYGDGTYARYFRGSGETQSDNNCSFFVYDLDPLDSDPTLKALITLSVFEEIRRVISLPENRSRGGFIVFEEMGQLGKNNPMAAQYIIDFAETIRKLGFWLIGIAPRPINFFDTDAGRALWEASDNYVFMAMKSDSCRVLKKKSDLIGEVDSDIISSLKTIKGKYAEVYYTNKNKTKRGAFRFVPSKIDRWIAPTNVEDSALAEEALQNADGNGWLALQELLKKEG